MSFSESDLSSIISALENDFEQSIERTRIRRMLVERLPEALAANELGTTVPKPFDESELIVKTVVGEVAEAKIHYSSRISANPPQPIVPRIADSPNAAKKAEENAAAQERLLLAQWAYCNGPARQQEIADAQVIANSGWYLTLPRDVAWGLPDRIFYDDLTDEQIDEMKASGKLSPEPDEYGRYMESGENWLERRRAAAKGNAVSMRSLFTLEAIPGDMVRYRMDGDGVKYAYIVEELPANEFAPGTEIAERAAQHLGAKADEIKDFGIRVEDGKIVAGVTQGGERGSQQSSTINLVRFFDRECMYILAAAPGIAGGAKLIWEADHGGGMVPLIPAACIRTDSRRPGYQFQSIMEPVFAYSKLLNQVETLASNVAVFNSIPRWVYEVQEGAPVVDPDTGSATAVSTAPVPGLDPSQAAVVEGRVVQLKLDASTLIEMMKFYAAQLKEAMPSPVAMGEGATSGPAWTARQLLAQAQENLRKPVQEHAAAVKQVFALWIRWLRELDVPVYAVSAPGRRSSDVRGLIEIDPKDLVEWVEVNQSEESQQDRIVRQQHGIELRHAGVIDDYQLLAEYLLEEDPVLAEKRLWAQKAVDIVMGMGAPAAPGSVLAMIVLAVQGRLALAIPQQSPNAAIAMAEEMAAKTQAALMGQPPTRNDIPTNMLPQGGNPAAAAGIRQPGIGAAPTLEGTPGQPGQNMGPQNVQMNAR